VHVKNLHLKHFAICYCKQFLESTQGKNIKYSLHYNVIIFLLYSTISKIVNPVLLTIFHILGFNIVLMPKNKHLSGLTGHLIKLMLR